MRINFNQTIHQNYNFIKSNSANKVQKSFNNGNAEYSALPNCNLAMFPNVSFGAKFKMPKKETDINFLLKFSKTLRCAYSGMPMIPQEEMKEIFAKLDKRPNAQSAINYLQQYVPFMHDVESIIFDILKESSHKNKRGFQEILKELAPDSLVNLRKKQIDVINSANNHISKMSPEIAKQVQQIRDTALEKIEDNTFGRQPPLEAIKSIKATGKDLFRVIKVYQAWYKIPNSTRDIDAFIVKYSKKSHFDIAKRLISSSMATIEHIVPQKRKITDTLSQPIMTTTPFACLTTKKDDSLKNIILVSARFNNERKSMPLDEYIMLNSDVNIKLNLQNYINDVIKEVGNKKSKFSKKSWYPEAIRDTIYNETNHKLALDTSELRLTRYQMKENLSPNRLKEKYNVIGS